MSYTPQAGNFVAVTDADPSKLAHDLRRAAMDLARCLETDVSIKPVSVIAPLLQTMDELCRIATELGRAAISVDEPAAHAAYRAADHFMEAHRELAETAIRLRDVVPSQAAVARGRARAPHPPDTT